MLFIINWKETHKLKEWGDNKDESMKALLDNRLNSTIIEENNIEDFGFVKIECADVFVANSYIELQQHLKTYDVDRYKVANETGIIQFTEESYKSLETLKIFRR